MIATKIYLIRRSKKLRDGRAVKYWTLRWARTDGKMQNEIIGRVGAMTRAEAEAIRDQRMIDMGMGKVLRNKPGKITLSAFLEQDREAIRGKARATANIHRIASDHAIAELGADFDVSRVTTAEADKIHNRILSKRTINGKTMKAGSKATASKIVGSLKAAWNRGKARGKVTDNPFSAVSIGKVQSKQQRIFTLAECTAMVDAAPDAWWQCLIRLAFTTGMRLGEILNLTWADIDEKAGQVTISAKRAERFTVSETAYRTLEWSAKSHHERRVPLDAKAAELVQRMRLQSGGSPYVFLSLPRLALLAAKLDKGKLPETAQWINNMRRDFHRIQGRAWRAIAKARGVTVDKVDWRIGCFHDLRRTFGTHMAQAVPMHELQKLMGHSSITVTATFYTAVSSDMQAKAQAVFAAAG